MARKKNAAAVALGKLAAQKRGRESMAAAGRKGGLAGAKALNESLTAKQRSASALKAVRARWAKKKP